ncbi:MAG: hypothetical protein OXL37_11555 [Chloroflexota bacterium]|nr:hypothetical protein [Chloroflexota bacterium]MDE2960521.1 hypothetical protein [Chloroflexota bacterium]
MSSGGSPDNRNRGVRANAFDVLIRRNGWFLATFYTLWAALAGLLSYARVVTAENAPLEWPEIAIIAIVAAAVTVGVAFPLAFGLVEGLPMVLAKLYRDLVRQEGREEGREEGRAEANRAWEAWNERREAAEREGSAFTEPPPSRNGARENNSG